MYNSFKVCKVLFFSVIMLYSLVASAAGVVDKATLSNPQKMQQAALNEMGEVTPIPGTDFLFATTKKGERFIVSKNGRFGISGTFHLVDTWAGRQIVDHKALRESEKLPMENLGRQLDGASKLVYGEGENKVYVFIDPLDPKSVSVVKEAVSGDYKDFQFNFVYFPAVSKDSKRFVMDMHCLDDKEKLDVLMSGKNSKKPSRCNYEGVNISLTMAKLLNIKRIPYWIFQDGSTKVLEAKDLKETLNEY